MKKIMFFAVALFMTMIFGSCGNTTGGSVEEVDSVSVDTIEVVDSVVVDTVAVDTTVSL